ncbi:MAG: hypothetical protein ACQEXI_16185 [Pseudomonadota bacterium]
MIRHACHGSALALSEKAFAGIHDGKLDHIVPAHVTPELRHREAGPIGMGADVIMQLSNHATKAANAGEVPRVMADAACSLRRGAIYVSSVFQHLHGAIAVTSVRTGHGEVICTEQSEWHLQCREVPLVRAGVGKFYVGGAVGVAQAGGYRDEARRQKASWNV